MTSAQQETTPAIHRTRLDNFSPKLLDEVVESADASHIQLGRGRFSGDLLRAATESGVLDSAEYSHGVLARVGLPVARITVGLFLPTQSGGIVDGHGLDLPTPFLHTEGTDASVRLEPRTRWISFQVPRREIEALGLSLPDRHAGVFDCSPELRLRLAKSVTRSLNALSQLAGRDLDATDKALPIEDGFDDLLASFVSALSPVPTKTQSSLRRGQRHRIGTVLEYVEAQLSEQIKVKELCTVAGVSYKTLERDFIHAFGVAPRQFLSLSRLSRARRLLLDTKQGSARIADIAHVCGYSQLGQFAGEYRRRFGEAPSRTLNAINRR